MFAIVTKYLGPTNHRPGRISARCGTDKLTVSWDYNLSVVDNHTAAARALLGEMLRCFGGVAVDCHCSDGVQKGHVWTPDHMSRVMGLARAEMGPGASGYVFVEVTL